jgi:hypothetical protein
METKTKTMINTTVKGWKNRKRAIDYWVGKGYEVDTVEKTGKYQKVKDMFGLYDIICICDIGLMLFVQVTSNRPHSHKPYIEFGKKYSRIESLIPMQMVWIDRKGWKIFSYFQGNKELEK